MTTTGIILLSMFIFGFGILVGTMPKNLEDSVTLGFILIALSIVISLTRFFCTLP
jgi:hypothetical protein